MPANKMNFYVAMSKEKPPGFTAYLMVCEDLDINTIIACIPNEVVERCPQEVSNAVVGLMTGMIKKTVPAFDPDTMVINTIEQDGVEPMPLPEMTFERKMSTADY